MRHSVILVLALAGCATAVTPRNDPPKIEFRTSKTLDDTLACVVGYMSANNSWKYPFLGQIVVPNQSYEVRPGREIMAGGEPIFLTVTKAGSDTVVKGYAVRDFGRNFFGLDRACR